MNEKIEGIQLLREPITGRKLNVTSLETATSDLGQAVVALRTNGHEQAAPVGPTDVLLQVEGTRTFYPVIDGIPILLRPEALGPSADSREFDLTVPAFEEAYLEMRFYNQFAEAAADNVSEGEDFRILVEIADGITESPFSDLGPLWLDAKYDALSQRDAYAALGQIENKRIMQIGGKGLHALKFAIAGASESWLVTPMLGEATFGMRLSEEAGLGGNLRAVVAVAEELPFVEQTFDGIFAGGCAHHFHMADAMPEAYRVLRNGSPFVAVEPYHAPLYDIGTRIMGKREQNAHCSPMGSDRIAPLHDVFDESEVLHHGTFFRYGLLAGSKLGLDLPIDAMLKIHELDDRAANITKMRKHGSSIALIGRRKG